MLTKSKLSSEWILEYYKEKIQYQAGNYFLDINSGIEANIEEIIVRNNSHMGESCYKLDVENGYDFFNKVKTQKTALAN